MNIAVGKPTAITQFYRINITLKIILLKGLYIAWQGIDIMNNRFRKFATMIDCSRNGVMTVDAVKKWIADNHIELISFKDLPKEWNV